MKILNRFFLLLAIVLSSSASVADEVVIDNSTFDCIRDMTPVRGFFVDNLEGNLEGTVKISEAGEGAYPPGSVV